MLNASAIVLANLCVCYAMTKRREDAEKIMQLVKEAEGWEAESGADKKCFHSCIIDLVSFR